MWQAYEQEKASTWPEDGLICLIWVSKEYGNGNREYIARFMQGEWGLRDSHGGNLTPFVTHWHRLPNSPY